MKTGFRLVILFAMALVLASCSNDEDPGTAWEVSYSPPFAPIQFSIDSNGEIEISGNFSVVTPIGEFAIGVKKEFNVGSRQDLVLVLRDGKHGRDNVYLIKSGRGAKIVVDGRTTIVVGRQQVIVDITDAHLVEVIFTGELVEFPLETNIVTCRGAPPSHLYVGITARVVWPKVNVRSYPQVPIDWDANIITTVSQDDVVEVIGGPACAHEGYWWKVRTSAGHIGWMREAGKDRTFLAPAHQKPVMGENISGGRVLYSAQEIFHIGDEQIDGWASLRGPCFEDSFVLHLIPGHATLYFEVYGVDVPGTIFVNQFSLELSPQYPSNPGEPPNYWSVPYRFDLDAGVFLSGPNHISICSGRLPKERGGDLDDLQIRNIQVVALDRP